MSAADVVYAAQSQVGYLEKKSDAYLDNFTANAGNGNYTKYGKWYGLNPAEWCDMFMAWCANQAGELETVGKYAYVPYHVDHFKRKGEYFDRGVQKPKAGDIIFFGNADHVGIVESCNGSTVFTIEGNTKNSAGIGGVLRHSYAIGSTYIMGYGRPAYGEEKPEDPKTEERFKPWRTYRNGGTVEPVYKDTDRTVQTGSLNPGETCECAGRYGDSYLVSYKVDDTADDWAVGYVKHDGGVNDD